MQSVQLSQALFIWLKAVKINCILEILINSKAYLLASVAIATHNILVAFN